MNSNFILFLSLLLFANSEAQCPENIYSFQTQAQVTNFVNEYPNCETAYMFSFVGTNITDLSPLSYIDVITHLQFINADNITSLMAFDNTQILASLYVEDSDGLSSLDGIHFSNLQENTWLFLKNNSILADLAAFDDLNIGFKTLTIMNNPNLSQCAVMRVCQSVLDDAVTVAISSNGTGCSTLLEVETACQTMGINEQELTIKILLFPNPTSSSLKITTAADVDIKEVTIYNAIGNQLMQTQQVTIDLSPLANGIYVLEITSSKGNITKKVVKQ